MTFTVFMGPCNACGDGADFRSGGMTCKTCGAEFEKLCKKCATKPCPKCKGVLDKSENVFPHSLFHAVAKADVEGVQWILANLSRENSNISDLVDRHGNSLLHVVCGIEKRKVALEMCELLLRNGASRQMKDKSGSTALIYMVHARQYKPDVALLLSSSKDMQDNEGRTALMFAAKGAGFFGNRRGNLTVAEHLLSMGADPFICDNYGRTALGYAERSNDTDRNGTMIEFLQQEMLTHTAISEFKRLNRYEFDALGVMSHSPKKAKK